MTYSVFIYFFSLISFFSNTFTIVPIKESGTLGDVDVHEDGKIYYVHNKSEWGNGTLEKPWTMKQAHEVFSKTLIKGGDRLKHLPGVYLGQVTSHLTGRPDNPIICEPADYNDPPIIMSDYTKSIKEVHTQTFHILGGHTWYVNFIFKDQYQDRISSLDWYKDEGEKDVYSHDMIYISGPSKGRPSGVKLINCMIYDVSGVGVFVSDKSANVELYGNFIAFSGFEAEDRGHGPATYMRSVEGEKRIENNIVFGNHQFGLRAYGKVNNFIFKDNVSFSNGTISAINKSQPNLFIGGSGKSSVIDNVYCEGNICYHPPSAKVNVTRIGFRGTLKRVHLKNENYIGRVPLRVDKLIPPHIPDQVTYDNVNYDLLDLVKVVKNKYEKNSAHITVLNKSGVNGIDVDLAGIVEEGTKICIWDVQNFKGKPLKEQVYNGQKIFLPLNNSKESQPFGNVSKRYEHTPNEFNCFLVRASDRNNSLILNPK